MSMRNRKPSATTMETGLLTGEHAGAHSDAACSKNKKFWVNEQTRRRNKISLPSMAYLVFARNPISVSWLPLLITLAWVLLFILLEQFGVIAALPMIDDTVPLGIFAAVTFFVGFFYSGATGKRGGNIDNFKSLISAAVNTMSGLEANLNMDVLKADPKIKLEYHNNVRYVEQEVGAMKVIEETSELLSGLLAAQRNVLRGGFDAKKLPLDPHVISEILSRKVGDPLVTMQTMVWTRLNRLAAKKVFLFEADTMVKRFNKDLVDSLGNNAINASSGPPRTITIFSWFFIILWIAYMPFWIIPRYPGYFALIAAALAIVFYTALLELSRRMPDIYVSSRKNTWSDYNLAQDVQDGAANVDSIYMAIFKKVDDLKGAAPTASAIKGTDSLPVPALPASASVGGAMPWMK